MDDENIKKLLTLKRGIMEYIDKITRMNARLEEYLQLIDSIISEQSFATADSGLAPTQHAAASKPVPKPSPERTYPFEIVLMNKRRDKPLATMTVEEKTITIIPAEQALYDIRLGAFARFFTERILGEFQKEDRHRVENGEIEWGDAFDFEVVAEDSILQKVIIRNYRTEERLQKIRKTARWTFDKIYKEK